MRILLIALLVSVIASCSEKTPKKNTRYPDFALDQEVQIISGFYRGHSGKITGWTNCTDRDTQETTVCYTIKSVESEYQVNQKDLR